MNKLRQAIYLILGFLDKYIFKLHSNVSILCYHSVCKDDWRFSIDKKVIMKQLAYLKKNYDFLTLSDVENFLSGKIKITKPSVVLTFDDGYRDILELKDYLIKENIRPAFFILSDTRNANLKELKTKRPFLRKKEVQSLSKLGFEIGCHSATHSNLSVLNATELNKEIIQAKRKLEKELQIPIKYFAYPKGIYFSKSKIVEFVRKAKYSLALTMDDGFINTKSSHMLIPRVGVDRTHTFSEFKVLFSPSVIRFRQIIKKIIWRWL